MTAKKGAVASRPAASSAEEGSVLSTRVLNRTLLERQMLLQRRKMNVTAAVEYLVGMQAQAPASPYYALWSRLEEFRPEQLGKLFDERRVVRIALMRSTIHLVTSRDCMAMRPVVQPALDRALRGSYGRQLAGVEMPALAAAARALVDAEPRTYSTLGPLLAKKFPRAGPDALVNAARALVPLVQLPPRGVWGAGGLAMHTSAEAWLGRATVSDPTPDTLILRYLAAFGPATVNDVQAWSGLTKLRDTIERLRPRLRTFCDEQGRELFDLPGAPIIDGAVPAPPRFLPDYDNILLAHADRSRIVSDRHRKAITLRNGVSATVLVDGFVRGIWKITRERGTAVLTVELFGPVAAEQRAAVAEEGERLLAFAAEGANAHEVRFAQRREDAVPAEG